MKTKMVLVAAVCLMLAGCSGNSSAQKVPDPNGEYVAMADAFTASVKILTVALEAGAFDVEKAGQISVCIHRGRDCLNDIHRDLSNGQAPVQSRIDCILQATIDLLEYRRQAKGGVQ
jgi:hypothetical protein